MNSTNFNVEAITDMVVKRLVNESFVHESLDERLAFFNSQEAQNRQKMRKANKALRKSGDPDKKTKIEQNRNMTRNANKQLRDAGFNQYKRARVKNPTFRRPGSGNAANAQPTQPAQPAQPAQPQPQMLGNVDVNNPKTWPNDAKSAFQFVQQFQNSPKQGAGWLSNVRSQTDNTEFIEHVRAIINNYYAQRQQQAQAGDETLAENQLRKLVSKAVAEAIRRIR